MTSRISYLLAAVAGALTLGGCDVLGPGACTLVGCSDGLAVALQSTPTSAYRVEVRVPGSPSSYVFDCPDPARCGTLVRFDEFTPSSAFVTITTDRGTVRHEVRPSYVVSRPNGEDCPPLCRQATVHLPIPA